MGCDIHVHIELKIGGEWRHYNAPAVGRNYTLFGFMAGVRDKSVEPVSEPKGLPNDASIITKMRFASWGDDAHSVSWLGKDEIDVLRTKLEKHYGEDFRYDLEHNIFHTYLFDNNIDVRIVFWFDN
jgi:hypothetical protein